MAGDERWIGLSGASWAWVIALALGLVPALAPRDAFAQPTPYASGRVLQARLAAGGVKFAGVRVRVAVDRDDPSRGTTSVFARFLSGAIDLRRPSVAVFLGGPGQTCEFAHRLQMPAILELVQTFNVVCIEPRGMGLSRPDTETEWRDPLFYSSRQIADDADAIRRALRMERWSVYGRSNGSVRAITYAERYPDVVTAVVLEAPLGWVRSLQPDADIARAAGWLTSFLSALSPELQDGIDQSFEGRTQHPWLTQVPMMAFETLRTFGLPAASVLAAALESGKRTELAGVGAGGTPAILDRVWARWFANGESVLVRKDVGRWLSVRAPDFMPVAGFPYFDVEAGLRLSCREEGVRRPIAEGFYFGRRDEEGNRSLARPALQVGYGPMDATCRAIPELTPWSAKARALPMPTTVITGEVDPSNLREMGELIYRSTARGAAQLVTVLGRGHQPLQALLGWHPQLRSDVAGGEQAACLRAWLELSLAGAITGAQQTLAHCAVSGPERWTSQAREGPAS